MRKLKPYADFLFEVGILNKTPRSGFRHLGGWSQSIGEHTLRTAYIGYVLANFEKDKGIKIDFQKVLEMCLFHDLGESRAIDLDYISQKYTKSDEFQAIKDAVKDLSFGKQIMDSYVEYKDRKTIESIIAKEADILELLCSLREITEEGNTLAKDWIPPLLKRLKTDSGKRIAKELLKTKPDEWWYGNKKDKYWITGGKDKK